MFAAVIHELGGAPVGVTWGCAMGAELGAAKFGKELSEVVGPEFGEAVSGAAGCVPGAIIGAGVDCVARLPFAT